MTMRETLELGLTIDERLADGYYYSKSVRLLEYLLEHTRRSWKSRHEARKYNMSEVKTPWKDYMGDVPMHLDYFQGSMFEAVERMAEHVPQQHRL